MTPSNEEARDYAQRLAEALHAKHFPEVTQWKPLPDLLGLLTQIDNMTTALSRQVRPEEVGELADFFAERAAYAETIRGKSNQHANGIFETLAKLRAALASRPSPDGRFVRAAPMRSDPGSAQDGWVLVPREPTKAMEEAHFRAHAAAETVFASVPEIWAAMLAASPPALSGEGVE